ncbi:MAG: site-2 protease family protein [Candidatus Azotimanducaceae bacterium]
MISLISGGQYAVFILLLVALLLSLSFHEYGHAIVARFEGDNTAQQLGRLTINPIKHIDPSGLIMVILIGIGYAKPVPVDPRQFRSTFSYLKVALAGPGMNLLLAIVGWNFFLILKNQGIENDGMDLFFILFAQINLLLMTFNLIPLGPLDGHYVLPYFLPRKFSYQYRVLNERYGLWVLLILLVLTYSLLPLEQYMGSYTMWVLEAISWV